MQKFFVETNQIKNNNIYIIGQDAKHISKVLRMKVNDYIQICDKQTSRNYIAQIVEINSDNVLTLIIEELEATNESNVQITLYQGLPKADKMEYIIQKSIEIGVNKIVPVEMTRCVAKLDEKEKVKKIQRWQKIATSAAEQSKRDVVPIIDDKIKISDLITKINNYDVFFVAYEEEHSNTLKEELKNIVKKDLYKIGVLIGPEGGITQEEIDILKKHHAKIVTLGKRILRCETAPIVILSNIMYELEK